MPPPSPAPSPARGRSRLARLALGSLAAFLVLAGGLGLGLRHVLRASLPRLDGEQVLPGLGARVTVERDALGVPTVRGASRLDVARALGFLHGQERFFQMDLLRRKAAGELSELVGPATLKLDRQARLHRFRAVARRVLEAETPEGRQLVEAYAAGVNGGLRALGARPFEYLLLAVEPRPWQAEDSILAGHAMFLELHDETGEHESARGLMADLLPPALAEFLTPRGTEWDAPLVGRALPAPPLPGPDVVNLGAQPRRAAERAPGPGLLERDAERAAGSNNWAVDAAHSATGAAMVADDMHLGLAVPNTWYRASLVWPAAGGGENRVTGATLPGNPMVVVGSTGRVAWGFTNTQADWNDLVVLELDPGDREVYRTPEGPRRLEHQREVIRVKGAPDETLDVAETVWGPVVDRDHRGRPRVLHWTAHDPGAVNVGLSRLETAAGLEEALAIANQAGVPPQNFVCADRGGRIGWTVIGRVPRRVGFDGRLPTSWSDGTRHWDGWLPPEEYPRVLDPAEGRLWTANARTMEGEALARLGEDSYALGARQQQIRDALLARPRASLDDMLQIQLDDRALFLARWRDLVLLALTPKAVAVEPLRAEFRRLVEQWGGRASVDSAGYRLVRAYRTSVARAALLPLTAACRKADDRFDYLDQVWQWEGPLWSLVTEKPIHLLDPEYESWDALLLAAVDATVAELLQGGGTLADRTWGERNLTRVRHPLSRAVPALSRFLDMPALALPGDSHMPRFQGVSAGASQRMAVSPGREAEGYFHMPAGQSGHPLSPHYADGHQAWAEGRRTPFLPGPTAHTLVLHP